MCFFSFACLVLQFGGGPAYFISVCLLVVVQFCGGPADAGNCVAHYKSLRYPSTTTNYNDQRVWSPNPGKAWVHKARGRKSSVNRQEFLTTWRLSHS